MNADMLRIEIDSIDVRHLSAVGAIPGVVPLLAAARNGPGLGSLLSTGSTQLQWRAPGSRTFGGAVDCSADGEYVLCDGEDSDKWIRVDVLGDWLIAGSQSQVALSDRYNNGISGDDVIDTEALSGGQADYQLTLRNVSEDEAIWNLSIWMDSESDARTQISLDGESFSSPASIGESLVIASIGIGEMATLYVRRTVPAESVSTPKQLVHFHFDFDRPL